MLWVFGTSTPVCVENITVALWNQLSNSAVWWHYVFDYSSSSSSEHRYTEEDESWVCGTEPAKVVCVHSQDTSLSPLFDLVLVSNDTKISHQYVQIGKGSILWTTLAAHGSRCCVGIKIELQLNFSILFTLEMKSAWLNPPQSPDPHITHTARRQFAKYQLLFDSCQWFSYQTRSHHKAFDTCYLKRLHSIFSSDGNSQTGTMTREKTSSVQQHEEMCWTFWDEFVVQELLLFKQFSVIPAVPRSRIREGFMGNLDVE